MKKINKIIFIFFTVLTFGFDCQKLNGYFKKYNYPNEIHKIKTSKLECAIKCLKTSDCKIALVIEQKCSIQNECFSINYSEKSFILVKNLVKSEKIDSNFKCKYNYNYKNYLNKIKIFK